MRTTFRACRFAVATSVILIASCVDSQTESTQFCEINSAESEPPRILALVLEDMSNASVVAALGEPDYSPTDGQYYFSTEGSCLADGPGTAAAICGFVLEFRDYELIVDKSPYLPEEKSDWQLQSCSWGGIGE